MRRASHHLLAKLRGERVVAVVCPGYWDWVDRMEAGASQLGENIGLSEEKVYEYRDSSSLALPAHSE